MPVIRLDHMVIAVSDWQRPSTSIVRLSAPRSSTAAPTGSAFASRSCNSMSTVRASTRRPTWSACRCPLETVISAFAGTARSRKLLRTFDYTTSKWRPVPRPGAGGRTEHGRLRVVADVSDGGSTAVTGFHGISCHRTATPSDRRRSACSRRTLPGERCRSCER